MFTGLILYRVWSLSQPSPSKRTARRFTAQKKEPRIIAKSEAREAEIEEARLAKLGWDATTGD